MSYWGLNRWLLGRGRLRGCGRLCLGLLYCRHGRLLLQGGLLSQQLLLVQGCGRWRLLRLLLWRLLVEVLYQLLLGASLGHHRELGNCWLLSCWVYCLKLWSLGLLWWLVQRACWRLWLWLCLWLRRLLWLRLRLLLEEELLLVLGCGLGLSGQALGWSGRCLLWGGRSLWLLGLRLW